MRAPTTRSAAKTTPVAVVKPVAAGEFYFNILNLGLFQKLSLCDLYYALVVLHVCNLSHFVRIRFKGYENEINC